MTEDDRKWIEAHAQDPFFRRYMRYAERVRTILINDARSMWPHKGDKLDSYTDDEMWRAARELILLRLESLIESERGQDSVLNEVRDILE